LPAGNQPATEFLRSCAVSPKFLFGDGGILLYVSERNLAMTMILLLNAASSFLALLGIAGFVALRERRARREPAVQVLYVTTGTARRLPHS
jgi:hypothetical protein